MPYLPGTKQRKVRTLGHWAPRGGSKYSEDQERDDHGRFAGPGGGGGDGGLPETRLATDDLEYELGEAQGLAWNAGMEAATTFDPAARNIPGSLEAQSTVGAKMMVQENLAQATGLTPPMTADLVNGWAATSNDNDYRAMWMQKMAAEEFGVPLSQWQQDKLNALEGIRADSERLFQTAQMSTPFEAMASSRAGATSEILGGRTQEEVGRSFLREQYIATQAFFKEQGVTEVVAYRGQLVKEMDYSLDAPAGVDNPNIPEEGDLLRGAGNAMESWSIDQSVAEGFAAPGRGVVGYVERMVIPVERILSTPFTGYGCLAEGEIVVLGGAGQSEVIGVERDGDYD